MDTTDRMIRLVWRHKLGEEEGSRGPRKKWTLDQVVDTAIDFADAEGIDGLSMRKIADKLGTSAASLYTYVQGRDELLGLMIDQVMGRIDLPPHEGTVRERLTVVSDITREECLRHPWLIDAQSHRPLIGPHTSARYEWTLNAIEGFGLDDESMDHIIALIGAHATSNAAARINAEKLAEATGATDADWWAVNAPILDQVMPADAYPVSGRVGSTVGEKYQAAVSHDAVYTFGLGVILDGVEARLRS